MTSGVRSSISKAPKRVGSTRERLLEAAILDFAENGISGARVDEIARRAEANKQLLYHHFGNKEKLFQAALKQVFLRARVNDDILAKEIETLAPDAALVRFIVHMCETTWKNPTFQRIVLEEAMHGAKNLRLIEEVPIAYGKLIASLQLILQRGADAEIFRAGLDAREVYVSLMGMCGIRISNAPTLSISVGLPLDTEESLQRSLDGVVAFTLSALRP